jgi:hypothetical protein
MKLGILKLGTIIFRIITLNIIPSALVTLYMISQQNALKYVELWHYAEKRNTARDI